MTPDYPWTLDPAERLRPEEDLLAPYAMRTRQSLGRPYPEQAHRNRPGLRILEVLEYRYADFPGLNLSFEVRQAQALHSKRRDAPELREYLNDGQPFLEAQVVDAADSLAYDTHDLDDALNVGLITP